MKLIGVAAVWNGVLSPEAVTSIASLLGEVLGIRCMACRSNGSIQEFGRKFLRMEVM